jgi:hypothetical protein
MSGLNLFTSENILGLNASESGTFWYRGHGKLKSEGFRKPKLENDKIFQK